MDESKKHRCVLNIGFEIHPLNSVGECDGHIIPRDKLNEYGLKSNKLYKLDSENLHELLINLKKILDQFK